MSIVGSLSDFSLPEIFQFIENGHRTGLLTVSPLPESPKMSPSMHYIWVSKGSIVAAANHLDQQGLIALIDQYSWVSNRVVTKLAQFCPPGQPLGLYLRSQGALQLQQLEHLFQVQLVQQMCVLCQLKDGHFKFDQNVTLPMQEMTGLGVPPEALTEMLKKLLWLQRLFNTRNRQREKTGLGSRSEPFCHQVSVILDIAFFHCLNFTLFDLDNSITKLSQIFDLYERPYDLPKFRSLEAMSCVGD
jgi:hypothetical protein